MELELSDYRHDCCFIKLKRKRDTPLLSKVSSRSWSQVRNSHTPEDVVLDVVVAICIHQVESLDIAHWLWLVIDLFCIHSSVSACVEPPPIASPLSSPTIKAPVTRTKIAPCSFDG